MQSLAQLAWYSTQKLESAHGRMKHKRRDAALKVLNAGKMLEKILRMPFVLQRFSTSRARKSTNRLRSLIQDMLILKIGKNC
jgi:hypothetical protein